MKNHPFVKRMFCLALIASLSWPVGMAWAENASEMQAKLDDENAAGNITEEATYTDLRAVLNTAQSASSQEDQDSAKDAYNTLVMVNDGGSIKAEAVSRLFWP